MANEEALDVILDLRKFRDDIKEIINVIEDKTSISREEKELLHEKFKSLKSRLKHAAKRPARNGIQAAYFDPAVKSASENLRIASNSHPIKSNWYPALYVIRTDITYYLDQLEKEFPDA